MRGSKNPNPTNLEICRRAAGLSRKKLYEVSGISYRTIQTYEQRQVDINLAYAITVKKLAKAIGVPMEQIMNDE